MNYWYLIFSMLLTLILNRFSCNMQVTQACSAIAIIAPNAVTHCVAILLQSFIQRGFWAHLIASDILTFMARYLTFLLLKELYHNSMHML